MKIEELKAAKTLFCKNCKHMRIKQDLNKKACVLEKNNIFDVQNYDSCKYHKLINT